VNQADFNTAAAAQTNKLPS